VNETVSDQSPEDSALEASRETLMESPPIASNATPPSMVGDPRPGTAYAPPPRPGDQPPTIPDVTLERALGQGGMGTVYKGRQITLDRAVAVKAIRPGFASHRSFVERFEREAKVLAKLSHPNIVACYQAGSCAQTGQHYLLMEFVDGNDLAKWVSAKGPLSERDALVLMRQVAEGLEHALEAGVIHRDVKPENILLKPIPRAATTIGVQAKIVDLGLAALATPDPGAARLTDAGATLGTPATMAPEQASAPESIDHRADIYALGCTLYFAVTGRFPHEGETVANVLAKKLQDNTPDPRRYRADLSEGTTKLILMMMAYEVQARPATYEALVALIDAEVARLGGPLERTRSGSLPGVTQGPSTPKPAASARGPIVGLAALALAVLLGIGVTLARKTGPGPVAPAQPGVPPIVPTPLVPVAPPPAAPETPATFTPGSGPPEIEKWGDPWHAFTPPDLFANLDLIPKSGNFLPPDDDSSVTEGCNVATHDQPSRAWFRRPLEGAVRIGGFVDAKTSKEFGVELAFEGQVPLDVAFSSLAPTHETQPSEAVGTWTVRIARLDKNLAIKAHADVHGSRQRFQVEVVKGGVFARLVGVPGEAWVATPAPAGPLRRACLYVMDGVAAFDTVTVETVPN
jgi:hypothetical protein